ncbi:MAG: hypothetical protein QOF81_32 [Acidimicrobiaceae bacterium]|nr:hypothetical protein [Acidimicrobiaceae bacterium]
MTTNDTGAPKSTGTTKSTGATKSTGTTKSRPKSTAPAKSASPEASAQTAVAASKSAGDEITKALKDAAHAAIGFGVIGWNKTQVRRRELMKDLNVQRHQVETQLDGAKEQLATAIRHLDTRIEPVRHDIEGKLDKFSDRLPEQVKDIVESARKVARDTEHQVRQAVGAL